MDGRAANRTKLGPHDTVDGKPAQDACLTDKLRTPRLGSAQIRVVLRTAKPFGQAAQHVAARCPASETNERS